MQSQVDLLCFLPRQGRVVPSLSPPQSTLLHDSSVRIDKVFFTSCEWVSSYRNGRFPVSPTANILSVSPKLDLHDLHQRISDVERLRAFYPNATCDFHGTPSGALCVYKNGGPWLVRTDLDVGRILREARPVYDHPLQSSWRAVGERIYTLLDDRKVRWTSIDPLAFAEVGKETFSPLLLWIGVEPASLAYEDANAAAEVITFFLSEAGFVGVEVGFRESVVSRAVSGPKMLNFDPHFVFRQPSAEVRKPFTPALGLSISTLYTPDFEGTGALYLRESESSDRVFLLTCAHVVRPPPVHDIVNPPRKVQIRPRDKVIALGDAGWSDAILNMMSVIAEQDHLIRDSKDTIRMYEEEDLRVGEETELSEVEKSAAHVSLSWAQEAIEDIDRFHSEVTKSWTLPNVRVIGEIAHVEPVAVATEPHRFTRDWALIQLYNEKFDWSTFKGNKVYIAGNISCLDYCTIMFPGDIHAGANLYPRDCLLQASGVVQATEIHEPLHRDANGEKCLLVVKNGLATGTTIGRVMGMESFTRTYEDHAIKDTSIEIGVLPYGMAPKDRYFRGPVPFSAPGDSGAIVLTREGRILGMITGGAGSLAGTDITYLTPYWYIEEEIKKVFPDSRLYEVVK
ncbi:unnamed protein product [Peniophora sp. CBMAI 1063]|nr:unnamed protein product [Peniophora sp. CBMAI 1063]